MSPRGQNRRTGTQQCAARTRAVNRGLELMIAHKDGGASARATGRFARRLATATAPPGLSLNDRLAEALESTTRWLLDRQHDQGYWVGELEGDTILESEYVLLMAYLSRQDDPICAQACRYIREKQLPGRGWAIYPGGP